MSITRTLTRRGRLGTGLRRRSRIRRPGLRVTPRMRLAAALSLVLAGLLFGAWMWVRDSSLVGVDQVTITGASGADATAIRSALRSAAHNMTTLDVQMSHLRMAVAPFPDVKRLAVKTEFPHRLVIDVIEQRPVGLIDAGGRQVPVAADGTILRSVAVNSTLPMIPVTVPPVGSRLREGRAAEAVAILAAAPYQLLPKVSQVTTVAGHGFVAQLRTGPSLYFGDTSRLAAKWTAATEVLANQRSAGASYIDVTDPARPAAGAGSGSGGGSASPSDASVSSSASPSDASASSAASGVVPTTSSSAAASGG